MIATLLAIGLFTIHVSPYFLIEQSVVEHNGSDTIFYEYPNFYEEEYDTGYVISQLGDVVALGVTFGEKYLWTSFSFGIPTYGYSIKFLPFFDVNTGIRWKNIRGYVGYHVPLKNFETVDRMIRDVGVEEMNGFHSIYGGIGSSYTTRKFTIDFDLQLRKDHGLYSKFYVEDISGECYLQSFKIDTSHIQTIFTTKTAYTFRGYSPFVFLSIHQRDFSEPLSLRAGVGIVLGKPQITPGKYEGKITHSHHYYIGVYPRKPNIYLYPEKPCSVSVLLSPDGIITVSDPPYENGWNVFAFKDGTIQNTDGYLFYEAQIKSMYVKDEGWCITKNEISTFFYSTLTAFGFNTKETEDFVSYWKNHLPNSPFYLIYTGVNEEIDKVCPMTVYPKPDARLRVWFVIKPVSNPVAIEPPSICTFVRYGFVVTEWGVILEDSRK